jgi:hypothetical protein
LQLKLRRNRNQLFFGLAFVYNLLSSDFAHSISPSNLLVAPLLRI